MSKSYPFINNKGMTLIEILVSITILSIVIIYFFSFFSQSTMFTSKIEDKLTATNVAEGVLSDVKNNSPNFNVPRKINGKFYYPSITFPSSSTQEDLLKLKPVNIKIYLKPDYNSMTQPLTEIYGYIKGGG